MALSGDLFQQKLRSALHKVQSNPETEYDTCKEFALFMEDFVKVRVEETREGLIFTFLQNLYQHDFKALSADLAKIKMLQMEKEASKGERLNLLSCLMGSLNLYLHGDYSRLISKAHNTARMNDILEPDDDELPYH